MKVFKIILILVLLSISAIAYGVGTISSGNKTIYLQPLTQGEITEWQESYGEIGGATTHDTLEMEVFPFMEELPKELPNTLLEWFKSLALDEKVAMYNWWKYESVNLKIDSKYGELFIRLDKE